MERIKLNIQRFATTGTSVTPANEDGTTFYLYWRRTSYSIENNTSTIYWALAINAAYSYYSNAVQVGAVTINGQTVYGGGTFSDISRGEHALTSGTLTIQHNNDGTKSFNTSISGWTWECSWVSKSDTFTLDTIPRYATCNQSLRSKTETSITMNWSSDSTIDYVWYSTNNGTNWTAVGGVNNTNGSYTISGLSANTTYNIKTRVRRKDSQLTTDSSASSIATYNWPNCTSAPNFIIGNSVTLQFYNPLNRTFDIRMWSHSASAFVSDSITISGTSYTFTPDASTLYATIPNAKSSVYNIDSTYNTHKIVKTGGSYSVNETTSKPTFNDFTYADTNTTTLALTGDSSIVVQNYSNITATISTTNKAIANNSATMSKYNLVIGNNSTSVNYSDNESVSATLNNASSNIINLYAEDSRGLTKLVTKTATLKAYTTIQKNEINVERAGNVGTGVTLTYNGTLWGESFGSVTNTAKSATYRFKKTSDSNWTTGTTTITPTTSGNDYSFTGGIAGDLGNTGFSAEYSFNIEIEVFDELSSTVFSFTLGTGIPPIAVADEGIAIKQPYNTTTGGALQVNGNTNITGTGSVSGNLTCGSFHGRPYDFDTNNTTDTWVPVAGNGKWQHRVIPKMYNTSTPAIKMECIDGRIANANIAHTYENGRAHVQLLQASSSMTSNKPASDGFILHFSWDNSAKCDGQFFVPNQVKSKVQYRQANDSGTWGSWEDLYRAKSLYDNSTGSAGNVTLSESSENFSILQIFYYIKSSGNSNYGSTFVYNPNGKRVGLVMTQSTSGAIVIGSCIKTISGTSITNVINGTHNSFGGPAAYNEIFVYKVLGYR